MSTPDKPKTPNKAAPSQTPSTPKSNTPSTPKNNAPSTPSNLPKGSFVPKNTPYLPPKNNPPKTPSKGNNTPSPSPTPKGGNNNPPSAPQTLPAPSTGVGAVLQQQLVAYQAEVKRIGKSDPDLDETALTSQLLFSNYASISSAPDTALLDDLYAIIAASPQYYDYGTIYSYTKNVDANNQANIATFFSVFQGVITGESTRPTDIMHKMIRLHGRMPITNYLLRRLNDYSPDMISTFNPVQSGENYIKG